MNWNELLYICTSKIHSHGVLLSTNATTITLYDINILWFCLNCWLECKLWCGYLKLYDNSFDYWIKINSCRIWFYETCLDMVFSMVTITCNNSFYEQSYLLYNLILSWTMFVGNIPSCEQETSASAVRDVEWATNNCTLSFSSAGILYLIW